MDSIRSFRFMLVVCLYFCLFGLSSGCNSAYAQGPPLPPVTHVPRLYLQPVGVVWGTLHYGDPVVRLLSYDVSGQDLTDTVHIQAPDNFEIRLDSLTGPFTRRISLPSAGQLSPTRFFIRLMDSLPAGTYNGELLAISAGQLGIAVGLEPAIVAPRPLQIQGLLAQNKVYDGTASGVVGGQAQFSGLVYGESFAPDLTGISWVFASAGASNGIPLSALGVIPTPSPNYTVLPPNLQADILPKSLAIGGLTAQSRTYDGGILASVTGTAFFVGLVAGDTFTPPSNNSWRFENKMAGLQKLVYPQTAYPPPSPNYTVDSVRLSADLLPAALTVQSALVRNKVYDRTSVATVDSVSLGGILSGDSVQFTASGQFQQFRAGNQIPVTLNFQLTGADGPNYVVTTPTGYTASITPRPLQITGLTVAEKEYDGTRTATLLGIPVLQGLLQGDELEAVLGGQPVALFASADTGRNIPVTVSGYTLTGPASSSYTLSQPAGLSGDIVLSVLAAWTFQPVLGTLQQPESNTGMGTLSMVGSMGNPSWSGGMSNHNGCGTASTTSAGDTAWSLGSTNPGTVNQSSGIQMMLASTLYRNIKLVWEQRWSGTSPNTVRLQYTTDGSQWVNITLTNSNTTYCLGRLDNGRFETDSAADKFRRIRVDLSRLTQLNEQPVLGFRIVAAHFRNTGAFRQVVNPANASTSGAWRFDNIRITGNRAAPTVWNGLTWSQGLPDSGVHAIVSASLRITQNLYTNRLELDSGAVLNVDSGATLRVRGTLSNRGILHLSNGTAVLRENYTGAGVIRGSTQSRLELSGLSDAGTVYMDSLSGPGGRTLESLVLNMGSLGRLRLGNRMLIHRWLDIRGGTLQTNDLLCLTSTSDTQTAQIMGGNANSIQGKIEFERYLPWTGPGHNGYRFVGSPLRASLPFTQVGGLPSTSNGIIRFSEPFNTYLSVPQTGNQWGPAQGYGIWTDTIRTLRLSGDPQLNASGPYFLQNQSARWNLMGNPFPAAMCWDSVQRTNAENAVWVWKKDSLIVGAGVWAAYINGTGANGASGVLAPMQGFMVRAGVSGLSSVSFPASARQPGLSSTFARSGTSPQIRVGLEQQTPHFVEETIIRLSSDAGGGFDACCDAGYLADESTVSPSLSSLDPTGYAYSIQSLPDPGTLACAIPLRTYLGQSGNQLLRFGLDAWPSGLPVFLEDRVLQQITTIVDGHPYSFNSTGASDSLRFLIHLNSVTTRTPEVDLSQTLAFFYEGQLHIRGLQSVKIVELRDVNGRLIHQFSPVSEVDYHTTLPIREGIYLLTLHGQHGVAVRKLANTH